MTEKYRVPIEPIRTNEPGSYFSTPTTLAETAEGDFIFGADGDLLLPTDTEQSVQRILYTVHTRLNSSEVFPGVGNRLRTFLGRSITEEVLVEMETVFTEDLINNNIPLIPGSLEINPIDPAGTRLIITFGVENPGEANLYFEYMFDVDHGAIEQIGGSQT